MGKAALAVVLLVLLGASVADCKVRGSLVASHMWSTWRLHYCERMRYMPL